MPDPAPEQAPEPPIRPSLVFSAGGWVHFENVESKGLYSLVKSRGGRITGSKVKIVDNAVGIDTEDADVEITDLEIE